MKKILGILVFIAVLFGTSGITLEAATNSNNACVPFDEMLYYAKDTWLRTVAGYTDKKQFEEESDKVAIQVAHLHDILAKEGFTITSKEKDLKQYALSTATAVAGLQNKYKQELLTSQGLAYSHGVLDSKGIAFLNQKYPCPTNTGGNGETSVGSIRFTDQGKTVRIKEKTLLNARYVVSRLKSGETSTTTFSYINKSTGAGTQVDENKDKDGRHILGSVVPAAGTYTVRAKIHGNSKVSEFTLVSLPESSGASGSNGSGSGSGSGSDTPEYKASFTNPSGSTSVKAGSILIVKGTTENLPNNTRVELHLIDSNNGTRLLKSSAVYACSNNYCNGFKASTGIRTEIPSNVTAGTYKIKAYFFDSKGTKLLEKESSGFSVTN